MRAAGQMAREAQRCRQLRHAVLAIACCYKLPLPAGFLHGMSMHMLHVSAPLPHANVPRPHDMRRARSECSVPHTRRANTLQQQEARAQQLARMHVTLEAQAATAARQAAASILHAPQSPLPPQPSAGHKVAGRAVQHAACLVRMQQQCVIGGAGLNGAADRHLQSGLRIPGLQAARLIHQIGPPQLEQPQQQQQQLRRPCDVLSEHASHVESPPAAPAAQPSVSDCHAALMSSGGATSPVTAQLLVACVPGECVSHGLTRCVPCTEEQGLVSFHPGMALANRKTLRATRACPCLRPAGQTGVISCQLAINLSVCVVR